MTYIKPTIIIFIFSLGLIGKIFWEQEFKYTLPTPVPEAYAPVEVSQTLNLNTPFLKASDKPKHLHFYNPDCPCSRFNLSHFSSLVRKHSKEIDFYIILPSDAHLETVTEKFGKEVMVIADQEEKIAQACGVYATPQAVIIDQSDKLYYRGNYNKSRYCTTPETNYAAIALDLLLADKPAPNFDLLSTTAYGCELSKKSWFQALIAP